GVVNQVSVGRAYLRSCSHDPAMTRAVLEFETQEPMEAFDLLRKYLPASAVATLTAGFRLQHTMRCTPCWPPNAESFTQPSEEDFRGPEGT
ncbi:MAG: hypothetical protein WBG86_04505, partial [Polyangiales bacterium]